MQPERHFTDQNGEQMMAIGHRSHWPLEEDMTFLNHGSFGCCPRPVLAYQQELRDRLERQPVRFFVHDLESLWDEARTSLAHFLGATPEGLTFVANATHGVNTVLRSLEFEKGDELLVTDHEYNACRNALNYVAERTGAMVSVAKIDLPVKQPEDILASILEKVTSRTKLLLIDHVSSPTAVVFPMESIVKEMRSRGIETLVDGAHAPGMLPLDLENLGAEYYTGNCHKWLCAPKGAAFLYVRPDCQPRIRPLAISHGANATRKDRSPFHLEFSWTGTSDPTACLSVPKAIEWVGQQHPKGWPGVMERNNLLALCARSYISESLNWQPTAPVSMVGSMVSFHMPDSETNTQPTSPLYADPLQDKLWGEHRVEVPIIPWPAPPKRLMRISSQLYNAPEDYFKLTESLKIVLPS
jgi:isopenicillin-N epimerase